MFQHRLSGFAIISATHKIKTQRQNNTILVEIHFMDFKRISNNMYISLELITGPSRCGNQQNEKPVAHNINQKKTFFHDVIC